MELRKSRYGQFWGCTKYPDCLGAIGAHPDGAPLGIPGDKATRQARINAHAVFDAWWKSRAMKRSAAYTWLAKHGARPHIAEMDAKECADLVKLIRRLSEDTGIVSPRKGDTETDDELQRAIRALGDQP